MKKTHDVSFKNMYLHATDVFLGFLTRYSQILYGWIPTLRKIKHGDNKTPNRSIVTDWSTIRSNSKHHYVVDTIPLSLNNERVQSELINSPCFYLFFFLVIFHFWNKTLPVNFRHNESRALVVFKNCFEFQIIIIILRK